MRRILVLVLLSVLAFALLEYLQEDLTAWPVPPDLAAPAAGLAGLVLLGLLAHLIARRRRGPRGTGPMIVVDGSNVMHWQAGNVSLAPLRAVIAALQARGYDVGVVFDANAGYKLIGRYQHDHALGRALNLPTDNVMVMPKGQPADPFLLNVARKLDARVVSNDRFRDWAGDYPEVARPGHVIRGGFRDGALWLDLDEAPVARSA